MLIERYLFRQLLGPTLLAIAALSGVALLSQSLSALDILVDQRQSPLIFARITLLALPQLIIMILPVAVLVAAMTALNRLHTEQEIVICFAGGLSRWRVISPAMRLAALATLVSLALTLWVQPYAYRAMRETLQAVRADLAATMIKPGRFTHPAPGLTVYAQAAGDNGTFRNLFLHQQALNGRATTVTARDGALEKRGGVPVLVMRHGATQEFSKAGVLNYLSFDEYTFDLRGLVTLDKAINYKASDRYLHELFFPDLRHEWERNNRKRMLAEGHSRLASPLYNLAFMAMALAAVIGGAFSKMGYAWRMGLVGSAAILTRTIGFAVQAAASSNSDLNAAQYAIPLAATAWAFWVLFRRPRRRPQQRRAPRGRFAGAPA